MHYRRCCIRSLANQPIKEIIDLFSVAAWALIGFLIFLMVVIPTKLAFRNAAGQSAIHAQCSTAGNIVFLGFPMLIALVGDCATAPVALVAIVDVVILTPIAIVLLETSCGEAKNWAGSMLQVMRTSVVHPIIISITAGLCLSLLEVPFIVPVDTFLQLLGAAAAPGALFAFGAFLGVNPRGSGLTVDHNDDGI